MPLRGRGQGREDEIMKEAYLSRLHCKRLRQRYGEADPAVLPKFDFFSEGSTRLELPAGPTSAHSVYQLLSLALPSGCWPG